MQVVSDLLKDIRIPKMIRVRQCFDDSCIADDDIAAVIRSQLDRPEFTESIHPGMRIAVTCGSRGIHKTALMAKTIVDFIKACGAEPFIVAAMGSHGGATSEGQRQILADYGITPESMGCDVKCDMDTVEIGISPELKRHVRIDKNAAAADGIILFNRIKPHTSFRGNYESGMMKMMAIGLGKQHGADDIHGQSPSIMYKLVEDYGRCIMENCPVLGGIAVIENAYDKPWKIQSLTPSEIITEEPKLLKEAYGKIAGLMFDSADVLVVDKIGKNISGDGMDPNVTGRFCTAYASGGIKAERVVVLDLTDETHGNAQGVGLADCTTRRLYDKLIMHMTYPTGVTNTFLSLFKIPMVMDNDREAIQLALKCCPDAEDKDNMKMIRIPDTAHLEYIEISESLLPLAEKNPGIQILSQPYDWNFDANGNLF